MLEEKLYEYEDPAYKEFNERLIPNLKKPMIGVRVPDLRKISGDIYKKEDLREDFLKDLPHTYHEEDLIHGYLLERIKDYDMVMARLEDFLPHIENWAVCDSFTISSMKDHREETYERIKVWLRSDHTYTVRFGLVSLIKHFTKEDYVKEINGLVAGLDREDYYIQMAQAWYFQKALVDQRSSSLPYFENILEGRVRSMAIQKALDSYKIDKETKDYLRKIR